MKEQENSPEVLDEWRQSIYQIVRVMIIRILNSVKKDIETIKKGQSEIKNAILKYIIHWKEETVG